MNSLIKKSARAVRKWPKDFKKFLHAKIPSVFGTELNNGLVQLYVEDGVFSTAVSFNHFVEFLTNDRSVKILFDIQVYDKKGKLLGKKEINAGNRGTQQIFLKEIFPRLDKYGIFTLDMKIEPKYPKTISYAGVLSPQFMTLYVAQDGLSATQMIHSHKHKQYLVFPKKSMRSSAHVENLKLDREINLYVLNSSINQITCVVKLSHPETKQIIARYPVLVPGYGCEVLKISENEIKNLGSDLVYIEYEFTHPVNHQKPIVFRRNPSGAWSCNHT